MTYPVYGATFAECRRDRGPERPREATICDEQIRSFK